MPGNTHFSSISVSLSEEMQRDLDIYCAIRRVKDKKHYSRSSFIQALVQDFLDKHRAEIDDYKKQVFKGLEGEPGHEADQRHS
ncbi:MAG: ribbon-helix-helix domain-containing protein [Coriobacteriia bacterium]|nr:ribbon-helix-helix domain-containing protein [Coriobacteriia bacterium]